jgi:hypothetical protein
LPKAQVKELISVAEAAPYGKGLATVRDEKVRRCWQIDSRQLSMESPGWKRFLKETLARAAEELGVEGQVSASLYKLLVYEEGGHFLRHRDTEKLEAMFGTLIIALPSAHEGGRLLVRHGGREVAVDFSGQQGLRQFQSAAFFADCEHEVEPVRSGYRCCLVYNLRLDKGDPSLLNVPLDRQAETLLPAVRTLAAERAGELSAVLLEHRYTEANFSLRHLKGNDQARARALLAAARESGLVAHLALVMFHQMGELSGGDNGYGYDYDDDEEVSDEGVMGEVYEESLQASHWRDAADQATAFGAFDLAKDEVIAEQPLDNGEPDEKEGEGYTGNAGCTMEYWYRRAAVVLWAREDHEAVWCGHDFWGACRQLLKLAGKKVGADREAFQRLAKEVVNRFPEALPHEHSFTRGNDVTKEFLDDDEDYGPEDGGKTQVAPPFNLTLDALAKAGHRDCLEKLRERIPMQAFGLCDAGLWSRLFRAFGVEAFAKVFEGLLADGADGNRGALFRIVAALARQAHDSSSWGKELARKLASLDVKPAPRSWQPERDPAPPGDPREARILLQASAWLEDAGDRRKALAFLKGDGSLAYVRAVLGPVLLEKPSNAGQAGKGSLRSEALAFARETLAAEVARPLAPYLDWARPCPLLEDAKREASWGHWPHGASKRELLKELRGFMADAQAQSHDFVHRQEDRQTIEGWIKHCFLDLDFVTVKTRRPHTLRCTKHDGSYRHALKTRAADEALLRKLEKAG